MNAEELITKLREDISWLNQGCNTEREICDHINQAIDLLIQYVGKSCHTAKKE